MQKISTSLEINVNNKQFNGTDDVLAGGQQDENDIVVPSYNDDFFRVDEDEVSEPSNKKLKMEPTYEDDEELFTEPKPISTTNTLNLVNSILSALGSNKNSNPPPPTG